MALRGRCSCYLLLVLTVGLWLPAGCANPAPLAGAAQLTGTPQPMATSQSSATLQPAATSQPKLVLPTETAPQPAVAATPAAPRQPELPSPTATLASTAAAASGVASRTPTPSPASLSGGATVLPVQATASGPRVVTAVAVTGVPAQIASPAPAAPVAGAGRDVTLEDNGRTITMHVGERFLLDLGSGYDWAVTTGDPAVLSRVIGVLTIQGSQGLYEAHQPGQTTLSAAGDPACRQTKPPCMMPSRLFQVQVIVQ